MKHLIAMIVSSMMFPLFVSNSYATDEQELICHSGPGMLAWYSQSRRHQRIIVQFKKQNVSHANKKVSPGYCAFSLAGMGRQWSNKLYLSEESARDAVLILQISPTTVTIDLSDKDKFGLYPTFKSSLHPTIMNMMKMMHNHRRYVIRAIQKNIKGFGRVWVVKSIGWNPTL